MNSSAATILREAREQASLSQRELAVAAGTSQSVVGRIEAGLASPGVETLARMVEAAGFDLVLSLAPRTTKDPVTEQLKADVNRDELSESLGRSADQRLRANAESRG